MLSRVLQLFILVSVKNTIKTLAPRWEPVLYHNLRSKQIKSNLSNVIHTYVSCVLKISGCSNHRAVYSSARTLRLRGRLVAAREPLKPDLTVAGHFEKLNSPHCP